MCSLAVCIAILELDNGFEEIADAMTDLELPTDAKYAKDGIKAYLQDKRRETQEAVNKDLNLLGLRRWHYDHPKDYQEFINLFVKAYDGDMSFFIKGMSYLTEMLSLDGIEGYQNCWRASVPVLKVTTKPSSQTTISRFTKDLKPCLPLRLTKRP